MVELSDNTRTQQLHSSSYKAVFNVVDMGEPMSDRRLAVIDQERAFFDLAMAIHDAAFNFGNRFPLENKERMFKSDQDKFVDFQKALKAVEERCPEAFLGRGYAVQYSNEREAPMSITEFLAHMGERAVKEEMFRDGSEGGQAEYEAMTARLARYADILDYYAQRAGRRAEAHGALPTGDGVTGSRPPVPDERAHEEEPNL